MSWQFWRSSSKSTDNADAASAARNASDEDRLRTSARRRLIGAAVLVALTVLIFPWVFKQQPRPLNDELIIEIPKKDVVAPLPSPAAPISSPSSSSSSSSPVAQAAPAPAITVPSSALIVAPVPAAAASSAASPAATTANTAAATVGTAAVVAATAAAATAANTTATSKPPTKPEPKPEVKPAAAKPELKAEAKPASKGSSNGARYVVQVAAFTEAAKARDVRLKLESQGYKTYSQAIDSPKGKVWRVRVGPFDNKAAAEKAKAQIAAKGFTPALLEL